MNKELQELLNNPRALMYDLINKTSIYLEESKIHNRALNVIADYLKKNPGTASAYGMFDEYKKVVIPVISGYTNTADIGSITALLMNIYGKSNIHARAVQVMSSGIKLEEYNDKPEDIKNLTTEEKRKLQAEKMREAKARKAEEARKQAELEDFERRMAIKREFDEKERLEKEKAEAERRALMNTLRTKVDEPKKEQAPNKEILDLLNSPTVAEPKKGIDVDNLSKEEYFKLINEEF